MRRGGRAWGLVAAALAAVAVVVALAVVVGGGDDPAPAVERLQRAAAPGRAATSAAAPGPGAVGADARSSTATETDRNAPETTGPGPRATGSAVAAVPAETDAAVPSAETGALPLAGRTIVVDPGHNGGNASHPAEIDRTVRIGNGSKACDTTGTESARGLAEHRYTWLVAGHARRALEDLGATVVLTREDDRGVGPCITRRMPTANRVGADVAVSIHADGGPSSGRGFHVILPGRVPELAGHDRIVAPSARLGRAVRDAFRRGTRAPYSTYLGRRGLDVRTDLGGLNLIRVPGVMIETGNMRNAADARLMSDPDWRRRAGRAIAAGVAAGLPATER